MSEEESYVVEKLFYGSRNILNSIHEKSDPCLKFVTTFSKALKHMGTEKSEVKKLVDVLFLKYLCLLSAFLKAKISGNKEDIDFILPKLSQSIVELGKSSSLVTKEKRIKTLSSVKKEEPINLNKLVSADKNKPKLRNLIPRSNKTKEDENLESIEIDTIPSDKYIPPKDRFVPYPFEKKDDKNLIPKSNQKRKYEAISNALPHDPEAPIEIVDEVEQIPLSRKNKLPTTDSRLQCMDEDIDIVAVAEGLYQNKPKKSKLKKRQKLRRKFRVKKKSFKK